MALMSLYETFFHILRRQSTPTNQNVGSIPAGDWRQAAELHPEDLVVESWSQGFLVGALIVMACITIANMRKRVLLHKLILTELLLAMTHGTFCFMDFNGYGWYLSATATLLYFSWIMHNIVAWMKVRPFFTQPGGFFKPKLGLWVQRIYLGTLALTVPAILFQITDNYRFFNNYGGWYQRVRPYEPLMRDPWWVFTCIALFHVIRKCYGAGVIGLIRNSPRFGILISAIFFSISFTIVDIVASIHQFIGQTDGINPWWKLSLVFKCLTDTIMLDDFKTELKRLGVKRIQKAEAKRNSIALVSEYPVGLDGPDSMSYSRPRRDTLFTFQHNLSQNRDFDSEAATVIQKDSRDDDNEDPLSEYTIHKESRSEESNGGAKNRDARSGEVEFATALALGPDSLSDVNGGKKDIGPHERQNIRITTKKISRLPGLGQFRFEAIKPGKRSTRRSHDRGEGHDGNNDNEKHEGSEEHDEGNRVRNLAEEIQRNTIMDLEAQKKEKETRNRARDQQRREENERLRRFRASIGAKEEADD